MLTSDSSDISAEILTTVVGGGDDMSPSEAGYRVLWTVRAG